MPTLQFKGKTFVQNHHLAVKYHQLVPKAELSLTDSVSLHDNLIIQGDNLKALKALLPTYAGKIKCIYIDPPYNTGNSTWIYNDNVNSPMIKEWLGKEVNIEDLTRHDKWLCMMTPRLKLLRELLSENGIIFIHINDYEIHSLRFLMDEIFGRDNLTCNFIWRTDGNFDNQAKIKICHEYIVAYSKNIEKFDAPAVIDPNTNEGSKLFKEQIRNTIVKNGQKNPKSVLKLPVGFPANFKEGTIKERNDGWPKYKSDAIIKKKNKIYPDFVAAKAPSLLERAGGEADYDTIFVLETKGIHLKNEDTKYKQDVFTLCNELGAKKAWKELFDEFPDHDFEFQVVFEDEWQN